MKEEELFRHIGGQPISFHKFMVDFISYDYGLKICKFVTTRWLMLE
jgi:hypothetical protein